MPASQGRDCKRVRQTRPKRFGYGNVRYSGVFRRRGTKRGKRNRSVQRRSAARLKTSATGSTRPVSPFRRRSALAGRLSHQGIPVVFSLYESEVEGPVFIEQHINGQSWSIESTPREENLKILLRVAKILGFVHSPDPFQNRVEAVVHCDIKPENVMISQSREIWLTDWGKIGGQRSQRQPDKQRRTFPAPLRRKKRKRTND